MSCTVPNNSHLEYFSHCKKTELFLGIGIIKDKLAIYLFFVFFPGKHFTFDETFLNYNGLFISGHMEILPVLKQVTLPGDVKQKS